MESGQLPNGALLDLSNAFDTLDHLILSKENPKYYGIDGSELAWFWKLSHQYESIFQFGRKPFINDVCDYRWATVFYFRTSFIPHWHEWYTLC